MEFTRTYSDILEVSVGRCSLRGHVNFIRMQLLLNSYINSSLSSPNGAQLMAFLENIYPSCREWPNPVLLKSTDQRPNVPALYELCWDPRVSLVG